MGDEVLAEDVGPALLAAGLPRIHASVIGSRAEIEASHNALLTRWTAYQVATEVLTHQVGPRVSPERARGFERVAASACSSRNARNCPREGLPRDGTCSETSSRTNRPQRSCTPFSRRGLRWSRWGRGRSRSSEGSRVSTRWCSGARREAQSDLLRDVPLVPDSWRVTRGCGCRERVRTLSPGRGWISVRCGIFWNRCFGKAAESHDS